MTGTIMEIEQGIPGETNMYRIEFDAGENSEYDNLYHEEDLDPVKFDADFYLGGESNAQWEKQFSTATAAAEALNRARFEHDAIVGRYVLVDTDIPRRLIGDLDDVTLYDGRGEVDIGENLLSIYYYLDYDKLTEWEEARGTGVYLDRSVKDLYTAHTVVKGARESFTDRLRREVNAIDVSVSDKIAKEIIKMHGWEKLQDGEYRDFAEKYRKYENSR